MEQRNDRPAELTDMAADLHAFELALTQAFAAGGRLAQSAARAQQSQRVSVVACAEVFALFSQANSSVSTAIGHTADGHRRMEALGRRLGIDVRGYGETQKPPTEDGGVWTGADGRKATVAA